MASCSAQPPNGNGNGDGDDDDDYGWKKTLPPGIVFYPSDVELITKYLKRKAQNLNIRAGIISDLDIYTYHPQELEAYAFNHCDGRMYFFSPFRRKSDQGRRGDRMVVGGKGYWKASQKRITMKDSNNNFVIGTKQSLVYYNGKHHKTSWLMSEFRLPPDFKPLPLYNQTRHELALCVIYHHGKRAIIDDDQESDESNANLTENIQSPNNPMPIHSPNPNSIATPTQNATYDTQSSAQNHNFIAASTLQSPNNHPSSSTQNPYILPSSAQNPKFITTTSTLQNPNISPLLAQNLNYFISTSTLQNSYFSLSSAQNPNLIATSTPQTPNLQPYSAQNPTFLSTSIPQNPNLPPYSIQTPNFIATSTLQNPNSSPSSAQNLNFIADSTQQNPNSSPSSAQNPNLIAASVVQDACELHPLPTAYSNTTTSSYKAILSDPPLDGSLKSLDKLSENNDDTWSSEETLSYFNNEDYEDISQLIEAHISNQQTLVYNTRAPTNVSNTCTTNVNSNMTSTATNHDQCSDPTQQDFGNYEEACPFLQYKDRPSY